MRRGTEELHAAVHRDVALGNETHRAAAEFIVVVAGSGSDVLVDIDIGIGRRIRRVNVQTTVIDRIEMCIQFKRTLADMPIEIMCVDGVIDRAKCVFRIVDQWRGRTVLSTDTVGRDVEVAGGVERGVEYDVFDRFDHDVVAIEEHRCAVHFRLDHDVLAGDVQIALAQVWLGNVGGDRQVDRIERGDALLVDLRFLGDERELLDVVGEPVDLPGVADFVVVDRDRIGKG